MRRLTPPLGPSAGCPAGQWIEASFSTGRVVPSRPFNVGVLYDAPAQRRADALASALLVPRRSPA
jgi:hypothetical protein